MEVIKVTTWKRIVQRTDGRWVVEELKTSWWRKSRWVATNYYQGGSIFNSKEDALQQAKYDVRFDTKHTLEDNRLLCS